MGNSFVSFDRNYSNGEYEGMASGERWRRQQVGRKDRVSEYTWNLRKRCRKKFIERIRDEYRNYY